MQNKIKYTKLKVYLKANDNIQLPNYHGSMLRGVMGNTIKEVSCTKQNEKCEFCDENTICPYTKIFYGINASKDTILVGIDKVPNSYIIEPLMNGIISLKKGESLTFNLIVIGTAIEYLSYYLHAIYKISERGLSKGNVKMSVLKIVNEDNEIVADEKLIYLEKVKQSICKLDKLENNNKTIDNITIYFETPARIKSEGKFVQNLSFEVLIKNIIRRITLLSEYYSEEKLEIDYAYYIQKAKEIKTCEVSTTWVEQQRYSSRTDKHVSIGGMVGKISYIGDLSEFYNIIQLGSLFHIGKGCVMGLGKYSFVIN